MIGRRGDTHRPARSARPRLRRSPSGGAPASTVTVATRSGGPRAAVRRPTRRAARRSHGWMKVIGWTAIVLVSLLLVTWRQTRGLALERGLRELEGDRALAEAESVELVRRIEELRSRARVVRVARDRLGMHLPEDDEIVFLPSPASSARGEAGR